MSRALYVVGVATASLALARFLPPISKLSIFSLVVSSAVLVAYVSPTVDSNFCVVCLKVAYS